jgi:uncharacterized protein YuzE
MKIFFDSEVDILRILFRDSPIEESDKLSPGLIFDYDSEGHVMGIEVLDASRQVENPRVVEDTGG